MSKLSPSARLALDAAIRDTIVAAYSHWRTYPIVSGKRCKPEPVIVAATLVALLSTTRNVVTQANVASALRRLVTSGELEVSTATIGTTEFKSGREIKAYSPATRYDVFFVDGSRALCNVNAVQCDAAIAQFGLVDTYRVSVSDRVAG